MKWEIISLGVTLSFDRDTPLTSANSSSIISPPTTTSYKRRERNSEIQPLNWKLPDYRTEIPTEWNIVKENKIHWHTNMNTDHVTRSIEITIENLSEFIVRWNLTLISKEYPSYT